MPCPALLPTKRFYAGESILLVIKDETLGPVQYAEKLYKKAAKHRRAVDQLQPLLDEASSQLEYVADVEDNILQLDRYVDPVVFPPRPVAHSFLVMACLLYTSPSPRD